MQAAVLSNITKTYHIESVEIKALHRVDIEIRSNCFTAISGPSGSGKTTLLNVIGCIDRPDAGELMVAGTPVGTLSDDALSDFRATHLGFVFQSFNLIPVLTAYENIEYPLRLTNAPPAQRRERVHAMLEAVGLGAHARHRPGQLSGGQQQRVACARALITRPEAIFADEPTGNLDSRSGAEVLSLLRRSVRELGQTVIMVTHDPVAASYADRVVFLADGRVRGELLDPAAADILDALKGPGC
jgi:putative ABC transport system ATP-binding protein